MKRPWLILAAGITAALIAYAAAYYAGSASYRGMMVSNTPELAWLKQEFSIPDAEFDRISKLHQAYSAACQERCARIDAKNDQLKSLLAATRTVTPAVEAALREAALLRAECQARMLEHFYLVSETMPPPQRERYLAWVINRTLGPSHTTMTVDPTAASHEHHGH